MRFRRFAAAPRDAPSMTPARNAHPRHLFLRPRHSGVYGWHRYYLVYLYMKHKDQQPGPRASRSTRCPSSRSSCPIYNEMYVADRLIDAVCAHRLPARAARDPGAGRLHRRNARDRRARRAAQAPRGIRHQLHPPHRPQRLQGRRARSRAAGRARASSSRSSTPTSSRRATSCAHRAALHATPKVGMVQARWGHINQDYSLLTKIQSILLDGHFVLEHGGRNRGGLLLQLQRHGRHLAPHRDRRRRRLAARHAHRGPRPELPRAAARLEVRVPARSCRAGRTAGRDERLQVAAAPLGQGLDPDLPQAAAARSCGRTCRSRSRPRRSST